MKLVLDTNFILNELRDHLVGKFKYSDEEADEAISLLESQMEIVTPGSLDQPVCRDADDDQVLATAVTSGAECIVTGDKDLLVLQSYRGIEIVRPSDFADFETRTSEELA